MSYHVRLNKKIRHFILLLSTSHQERIGKLIDRLSENSYPLKAKFVGLSSVNFDIKKCKGHKTRFRARFGEYRLVYQVDEPNRAVLLLKPDDRSDVY